MATNDTLANLPPVRTWYVTVQARYYRNRGFYGASYVLPADGAQHEADGQRLRDSTRLNWQWSQRRRGWYVVGSRVSVTQVEYAVGGFVVELTREVQQQWEASRGW